MPKEVHPDLVPTHFPPCCPELKKDDACDVLDFHYRTVHPAVVKVDGQNQKVNVEVLLHTRLERCPGPLALGDLVYSQTLFPGEKVRLFTTDRRSRFTFDSSTKVSYRNEQSHEEQYYVSSMSEFLSDLEVRDAASASNRSQGGFQSRASASGALESFFGGPSVSVSGSYNAESTSDFLRELTQHARASHHASEQGTRTASSLSIGEVQSRTHVEGESQDHFESASREFANPNRCHAITFYFYRLNKTQTVRFQLVAIERRVIDPAADTRVTRNPPVSDGGLSTIPAGVLATDKARLDVERIGRESVAAQAVAGSAGEGRFVAGSRLPPTVRVLEQPLSAEVRKEALKQVDSRLAAAGLLNQATGEVEKGAVQRFSFEVESSLPTPGLLAKGCLDECCICEPELQRSMDLDLQRKELENARLQRQIELMATDQEHRCCPTPSEPDA